MLGPIERLEAEKVDHVRRHPVRVSRRVRRQGGDDRASMVTGNRTTPNQKDARLREAGDLKLLRQGTEVLVILCNEAPALGCRSKELVSIGQSISVRFVRTGDVHAEATSRNSNQGASELINEVLHPQLESQLNRVRDIAGFRFVPIVFSDALVNFGRVCPVVGERRVDLLGPIQ